MMGKFAGGRLERKEKKEEETVLLVIWGKKRREGRFVSAARRGIFLLRNKEREREREKRRREGSTLNLIPFVISLRKKKKKKKEGFISLITQQPLDCDCFCDYFYSRGSRNRFSNCRFEKLIICVEVGHLLFFFIYV
jgi:hypothetical protein